MGRGWRIGIGLGVVGLLTVSMPRPVAAHERWFTPEGPYWDPEWNLLFSWAVLIYLLIDFGVLGPLLGISNGAMQPFRAAAGPASSPSSAWVWPISCWPRPG